MSGVQCLSDNTYLPYKQILLLLCLLFSVV